MNMLKIIKSVISEPSAFFTKVGKGQGRLGFAFGYLALFYGISTILGLIVGFFMSAIFQSMAGLDPAGGALFFGAGMQAVWTIFIFYPLALGMSFVFAGVTHLVIKLFGGKNTFTKTYEVGVYSSTPSYLLGWVPFIGFFASIWALVLLVLGIHKVHNISIGRSVGVLAVLIALLLFIFFVIFAIVIAIFGFAAFGGLAALGSGGFA